jgi:hypothetical protein
MQPIRYLENWLSENATKEHSLFLTQDLRVLFPDLSEGAFKVLLSRAVGSHILLRICRGLYGVKSKLPRDGRLLFHFVPMLRGDAFNYISLETVLSDHGVISQIPMAWISIMSSGRSSVISCGDFGTIEFIHTAQKTDDLVGHLHYDKACGLWRADVPLALRDMKRTRRNMDLINWSVANEFI